MVDLGSSSRQIVQKVRDVGGTAASESIMHPRKAKGWNGSSRQENRSYEPQRCSTGTVRSFSHHSR
jgi:hypothetical protein